MYRTRRQAQLCCRSAARRSGVSRKGCRRQTCKQASRPTASRALVLATPLARFTDSSSYTRRSVLGSQTVQAVSHKSHSVSAANVVPMHIAMPSMVGKSELSNMTQELANVQLISGFVFIFCYYWTCQVPTTKLLLSNSTLKTKLLPLPEEATMAAELPSTTPFIQCDRKSACMTQGCMKMSRRESAQKGITPMNTCTHR